VEKNLSSRWKLCSKGQILASTTVLNSDHLKALCMVTTRRRGPVEIEMLHATHSVCINIYM
jgi:molybdenum cofactor biosynthesis enzyme